MLVKDRGPTIRAGCRSNPTDRVTCPQPPFEPAMRKAVRIRPDRAPASRLRTAARSDSVFMAASRNGAKNFTDDREAFKL